MKQQTQEEDEKFDGIFGKKAAEIFRDKEFENNVFVFGEDTTEIISHPSEKFPFERVPPKDKHPSYAVMTDDEAKTRTAELYRCPSPKED